MAKKKKNSKKNGQKIEKNPDQKIQEQAEEVTEIVEESGNTEEVKEPEPEIIEAEEVQDPQTTEAEVHESADNPTPAAEEITDFTLVMDPVDTPVNTTALAPVIPAASGPEEPVQAEMPKKKKSFDLAGSKPVSRKMLAIALAAALLLNGAITAGIMALYTKSIKNDIAEVSKSVEDLESDLSDNGGGYNNRMTPPDWNSDDNGWNGYGWNDDDLYGYWDDDDRDDDDWYSSPDEDQKNDRDDQQGQQRSSGTSIGIVISDDNGVIITQVTGKKAQKAGFETGDKIVSFDGKSVSDSNSLIAEVQKHKSGDKVKVVVERDGKEVTIKTELE